MRRGAKQYTMSHYVEKIEKYSLPLIPMRGVVAFPVIPVNFEVSRDFSIAACEAANLGDGLAFLVTQRDIATDQPAEADLYAVGTVVKIKQFLKLPEGNCRVIAEGICRAQITEFRLPDGENGYYSAEVLGKTVSVEADGGVKGEALMREVEGLFDTFAKNLPKVSSELILTVKSLRSPGLLADFIACNLLINFADKQQILEVYDPIKRLETLAVVLEKETDILKTELKIRKKVREQIEDNQHEYYLREQLKAIQNELGYGGDGDAEIDEYYEKIEKAGLPKEVEEKLIKEVKKMAKTPFNSAESGVLRNYLDTCLEIPWTKKSRDRLDIATAKKILDRDHDGLKKVKERILEYLAVKELNPELKHQILCLVGPPGVGKTSVAISIASAMKRKYVRVSLGGVRDEADIRGHRKTYIGSMPGRIIQAMVDAKVRNPLILLDEIDKLTRDAHGDPSSALLEVLDSEQNKTFRDHFIELPLDLSDCFFIATANTLDTIPRPLIDRMEIIELQTYTPHEKLMIAVNHLIPKQLKRYGMNKRMLKIEDSAINEIIEYYTREAGVRNLEREISALCRKAAKKIVEGQCKHCVITAENLHEYLGHRKLKPDTVEKEDEVGVVNGLAYTEVGGDLLKIEVATMPGSGKIELTGSLGEVMKESARIAVSYIRSKSAALNIDPDFYKNKDIHIHVPEGAVPKDGPSAGVTLVTALTSELTGKPVRQDVAMTGEVTLRGKVLAIGGLKEKTMAAYTAGVKTVLIPEDNKNDLEDIDPLVREKLEFIPCSDVAEVLQNAIRF